MELVKKNIHMDHKKCGTVTQMTLDDDRNVPDRNPDVEEILLKKGTVKLEEVKATTDHVSIRGKLLYQMLYATQDLDGGLSRVSGEISFEEQVYLDCVAKEDQVTVIPVIDDLTIGKINSRKINIQAVITFTLDVNELSDVAAPIELRFNAEEKAEYRCRELHTTAVCISKNDIFRIKEELELPSSYPNIQNLIWESITLNDLTFKTLEDKLGIQGDLHVFYLFTGENDDMPVRYYSASIPVRGELECNGSRPGMIPLIQYEADAAETEIRPDFDGENRIFGIDLVLNMRIRLLCEDQISVITDLYGITGEIEKSSRAEKLQNLLLQNEGTYKLTQRIQKTGMTGKIMQLVHSEASAAIYDSHVTDQGIEVDGVVMIAAIYISGDDEQPYGVISGSIPFRELVEMPEHTSAENLHYTLDGSVSDLNVAAADGDSIDVKAVLHMKAVVFEETEMEVLEQVSMGERDYRKMDRLPGMAVIVFEEGDQLWNIGRKYCQPLSRIRELNGLSENAEPKPGSRILVVNHIG